ncbi:MAG: NAD(P)/FAD-dependent oxidoreductase [Bacilli bacterium]|nr:NAD(P)/FAD-dependent oxidoreductase [Bacilli bacterium]
MRDIIIIGSGIIGTSIARELSRYRTDILVLDKENDVSCGTTKANSGIVHAGFDTNPGSLKAKFNILGSQMFEEVAKELDFPYRKNGALVIAFSNEDIQTLEELLKKGLKNGVKDLEIISGEAARKLVPSLSDEVVKALHASTSAIASPYEMAIAYAENAAVNGVEFRFNAKVERLEKTSKGIMVCLEDGDCLEARMVINCAGVFADDLSNMVSKDHFSIVPRKGEYLLLDKKYAYYTDLTLFQTPTKMGKGVLVTPATHGNIIIGPTAVDIDDKGEIASTISGLKEVWEKANKTIPALDHRAVITAFTGLRAHSNEDDFIIGFSDVEGLYNVAGIESPGLSAAPAIALHVSEEIANRLSLKTKDNFIRIRKAIPHFSSLSGTEKAEIIKENPHYGKIICRCEQVTEAEIREAIRRPLGAKDLDGIKRRTRAGMGRCQAGFCTTKLMQILSEELKINYSEVTKNGRDSQIVIGKVK